MLQPSRVAAVDKGVEGYSGFDVEVGFAEAWRTLLAADIADSAVTVEDGASIPFDMQKPPPAFAVDGIADRVGSHNLQCLVQLLGLAPLVRLWKGVWAGIVHGRFYRLVVLEASF